MGRLFAVCACVVWAAGSASALFSPLQATTGRASGLVSPLQATVLPPALGGNAVGDTFQCQYSYAMLYQVPGYAAAYANYMSSNPQCFDPLQVRPGFTNCVANMSALQSICIKHGAVLCNETISMGKTGEVVTMDMGECIPFACSSQDLINLMESQANSQCGPNKFTTCSFTICGTSYSYTPPQPTASPCSGMLSPGGAGGLAIGMLIIGGMCVYGALWLWERKRGVNPVGAWQSSGKVLTSAAYTDI